MFYRFYTLAHGFKRRKKSNVENYDMSKGKVSKSKLLEGEVTRSHYSKTPSSYSVLILKVRMKNSHHFKTFFCSEIKFFSQTKCFLTTDLTLFLILANSF